MYLDGKFGLSLSLSEITLLFDFSLDLDRTLAQRKAKSKVKVAIVLRLSSGLSVGPVRTSVRPSYTATRDSSRYQIFPFAFSSLSCYRG